MRNDLAYIKDQLLPLMFLKSINKFGSIVSDDKEIKLYEVFDKQNR